jgi:hypothetical protein
MVNVLKSPPTFEDYCPECESTSSVVNYFNEEFGGSSFLEPQLNGLVIQTPVEEMIMKNLNIHYFEIKNLRHSPEGEEESEFYYDMFFVMRNLNSTTI